MCANFMCSHLESRYIVVVILLARSDHTQFPSSSFFLVSVDFHASLFCRPRDALVSRIGEGGNWFCRSRLSSILGNQEVCNTTSNVY
jgi:hypothetical protein